MSERIDLAVIRSTAPEVFQFVLGRRVPQDIQRHDRTGVNCLLGAFSQMKNIGPTGFIFQLDDFCFWSFTKLYCIRIELDDWPPIRQLAVPRPIFNQHQQPFDSRDILDRKCRAGCEPVRMPAIRHQIDLAVASASKFVEKIRRDCGFCQQRRNLSRGDMIGHDLRGRTTDRTIDVTIPAIHDVAQIHFRRSH